MKAIIVFLTIVGCGLIFAAFSVHNDVVATGTVVKSMVPFLLLGVGDGDLHPLLTGEPRRRLVGLF